MALVGSTGLWAGGCCMGGSGGSSVAPIPPPVVPPATPAVAPAPAAAQTIMAGAGLTPDPTVTSGVGGGPVGAQALSPTCYVGTYPTMPQLNVTVTAAMPYLAFVVSSEADLTMAVRRPDGSFACDDDGGVGLNPLFHEAVVPGDYTVYVGALGRTGPYTMAVTTLPAVDASIASDAVLRHGQFRVVSATGGLPIAAGTLCDYVQVSIPPRPNGLNVRWRVRCGDRLVYGSGRSESSGGFQYQARPDWPGGTIVRDAATSASDQDPSFVWDSTQIRIADDGAGFVGVPYDLTFAQVE